MELLVFENNNNQNQVSQKPKIETKIEAKIIMEPKPKLIPIPKSSWNRMKPINQNPIKNLVNQYLLP